MSQGHICPGQMLTDPFSGDGAVLAVLHSLHLCQCIGRAVTLWLTCAGMPAELIPGCSHCHAGGCQGSRPRPGPTQTGPPGEPTHRGNDAPQLALREQELQLLPDLLAQLPLCLHVRPEHRQARSGVLGQAIHNQTEQQQLPIRAFLQAGACSSGRELQQHHSWRRQRPLGGGAVLAAADTKATPGGCGAGCSGTAAQGAA